MKKRTRTRKLNGFFSFTVKKKAPYGFYVPGYNENSKFIKDDLVVVTK